MNNLKYFIESKAFGVCSYLGDKLGIPSYHIRLFFIYISFITLLSPLIAYMILAFWINMKRYITRRKNPVWD